MKHIGLIFFISWLIAACSRSGPPDRELSAIAAELNQKCPQMLDSETRIDAIETKGNDTLIYRYTLLNVTAQHVDTHQFRMAMWPGILGIVKANPSMKKLRDNKTTVEYDYRDKTGKPVYIFIVTPKDYTND